jgi:carboxylesterase type B
MVFFYGGDFKEGGESFQIYNGSSISGTTNTILVVTNYRIGNLGFLYTGTDAVDSNIGLADQRWTLKWVQQNIAAFGGNPNQITIFGQSAGGESVLIHMASPVPSKGLFQAAISESGPMALNFKFPAAAELLAEVFFYEVGCILGNIECLQNKTTQEILTAADRAVIVPLDISEAVMKWAPVVTADDNFPQQPLDAFQKGEIVKVPFIAGANLNDGVLFGWAISPTPLPTYEYIAIVLGIFQDDWVAQILEYYPNADGDNRPIFSQLLTDYVFYCASRQTLRWAEAAGIPSTYLYMFTQQPTFCPWPPSQNFCCNAVCHGDELAYVFHDSGVPYPWNMTTNDLFLSNAMTSYWTSFAATGNPNQNNQYLNWPIYRKASDMIMNLRVPLTPISGYNAKNCDFWDSVGYFHSAKLREFINKL